MSLFHNLWVRLGGCAAAALVAWLVIKFMNVQDTVVTAHILIVVLTSSLIAYFVVHTFLEHYVVAKVVASTPPAK